MSPAIQTVGVAAGCVSAAVAVVGGICACYKFAKTRHNKRQSRQQQDVTEVKHRLPYVLEAPANIMTHLR
jgi:hypothetical protein